MNPEKPDTVKEQDKVPLKEKIAYGCGGIADGLQEAAEHKLLQPVFVVEVGISPITMSQCGMLYRIWDGMTDLVMGWISDNTRTRWGRRRPYLFIGAILMAIFMPVLFCFNPQWSTGKITVWMIAISLMLYLTQTIYNVPYQALLYESTPDSNERTNVAAWRSYFGLSVQLIAAWVWWFTQLPWFYNTEGEPDVIYGARWVIGGLAVVVMVLGLMPALFMKERYYHCAEKQAKVSIKDYFKYTFQSRPFLFLILFVFVFNTGFNLHWGLEFYTKLYYVCGGNKELASTIAGWQQTLQVFTSLLGIPLFQWLARFIGKKGSLSVAVMVVFTASLSTYVLYTPLYPYLSMVPILLIAPASTALWVLVPSMMGDVVDEDELRTSERREGAFASIFSWGLKMTRSLASLLSGYIVVWAGFNVAQRHNLSPEILQNMRTVLCFLPSMAALVGFLTLQLYPLTTERLKALRAELEARRGVPQE